MSEFPFDDFKETDFNEFERFFKTNTVNPIYDHRANFQTNSPSFYEYLAKHNHLIKILAKRIYDYDKELAKRFEEWDKRIENLPDELKRMFLEWVDDGTLARILAQLLLDEYATKEEVNNLIEVLKEDLKIVDDKLDKLINEVEETYLYANQQPYRNLKDRLNASDFVLNLKSYGCKGDGKTDETNLIQKALNEYDTIFIPNGTYILSGINMLKLRSNMTLIFESKNAIFKVSDKQGDWQSMLYTDGLAKNITILGGTLDCNIKNTNLTDTNGWIDKGRILIRIEFGHHIKVTDMNFITNGFWAIRGKWKYGKIYNNLFNFDLSVPALKDFDISCIWLGGEHNIIENNKFISQVKKDRSKDYQGRTAIEFQGHYNIVRKNTVENFRAGIIITNSSSYENPILEVLDGGNKNSIIEDNSFINIQQGIKLWLMNTDFDLPIMNNLKIKNNLFKLTKYGNTQTCVGINVFRPLPSSYNNPNVPRAEREQNGAIHNLEIIDNSFFLDKRNDYHCIDLTPTVEMRNIIIKNNFIDNFRGFAIRTGHYQLFDGGTLIDSNDATTSDFYVENNIIKNCKHVINLYRNLEDCILKNNHVLQTTIFPKGENMIELVRIDHIGDYYETGTTLDFPEDIKPFLPKYKNNFYNHRYLKHDNMNDKVITKLKYIKQFTSDKQHLPSNYLLLDKGNLFRSASSFGTTFGELTDTTIKNVKINSGNTPSYFELTSTLNLDIHDCIRTKDNITVINNFPILAIEVDRVHLGYHPTFSSGKSINDLIGQEMRFSANVVNIEPPETEEN